MALVKQARQVRFPCIRIEQPLGAFYVGAIKSAQLCEITWVDIRRIEGERGFETYLGIQRPLNPKRKDEIADYLKSPDACFPTAVILAVPAICTTYDEEKCEMVLTEYLNPGENETEIQFASIAKVIDGQHRIAGLKDFGGAHFDVNVSVFVDMDIADQAHLFATVNLAQTKVNKSLVYDLFDLAKTRSPQKTAHNVAVALDQNEKSPLYQRIKRLGVATKDRFGETISQATFVESLMPYLSKKANEDRRIYLSRKIPKLATAQELRELIFRNMLIEERDLDIADILWHYFDAVKERWPTAWGYMGGGLMLNKTNGFRALMRFLRPAYLYLDNPGGVPARDEFISVFKRVNLPDEHFNTDNYKPGTSGESQLFRDLVKESGLGRL